MKKVLLSAALIASGVFAFGQQVTNAKVKSIKSIKSNTNSPLRQGRYMIGGTIGFDTTNIDEKKKQDTHNTRLKPEVGYLLKDNLMLGLGAGYEKNNSKETYTLDPFIRKYWSPLPKLGIYAQAQTKLGWADGGDFVWGASIRPGVSYFLSDKIAIDTTIGGLFYDDDGESEHYGAGFDFNDINIGFKYFIK